MSSIVPKRVSNYELFYDLVFVLAMSRLNIFLHTQHFQLTSFIAFLVSCGLVMSIWMYQTIYLNKYGERDPMDVYLNIPAMFIMGNFALMMGLQHYAKREFFIYNGLLLAAHGLIWLQYYLRGWKIGFNEDMLATMKRLMWTMAYFALLVVLVGVFNVADVNNSYVFTLWLLPWLFPLFSRHKIDIHRLNFPHLVERC